MQKKILIMELECCRRETKKVIELDIVHWKEKLSSCNSLKWSLGAVNNFPAMEILYLVCSFVQDKVVRGLCT